MDGRHMLPLEVTLKLGRIEFCNANSQNFHKHVYTPCNSSGAGCDIIDIMLRHQRDRIYLRVNFDINEETSRMIPGVEHDKVTPLAPTPAPDPAPAPAPSSQDE